MYLYDSTHNSHHYLDDDTFEDSLLALDDTQFVGKRLTNREIERSTERITYDAEVTNMVMSPHC